jgi:tetratricopeptide (TPR) repeat protein
LEAAVAMREGERAKHAAIDLERAARAHQNDRWLFFALSHLILKHKGRPDDHLLYDQATECFGILRRIPHLFEVNPPALAALLNLRASAAFKKGDQKTALDDWAEAEKLARELGTNDLLILIKRNLAQMWSEARDARRACPVLLELESLVAQSGGVLTDYEYGCLLAAVSQEAARLHQEGKIDEAIKLKEHEARISREGNPKACLLALREISVELGRRGRFKECLERSREWEEESVRQRDELNRMLAVNNQVNALVGMPNPVPEIRDICEKEERLCRECHLTLAGVAALGFRAQIEKIEGRIPEALALYKEQEQEARKAGAKELLAQCLTYQGWCYSAQGNLRAFADIMTKAVHECGAERLRELAPPDPELRKMFLEMIDSIAQLCRTARGYSNGRAARPALPGRNTPCPCGSGKKYKKCCGKVE